MCQSNKKVIYLFEIPTNLKNYLSNLHCIRVVPCVRTNFILFNIFFKNKIKNKAIQSPKYNMVLWI